MLNRRTFLTAALAAPLAARKPAGLMIGLMDGVLRLSGKAEAVGLAKSMGFEALQITIGRANATGRLPLEDAELQSRFVEESKLHKLPIAATYLDMLHADCLKDSTRSLEWVLRGIDITHKVGAQTLMTVFFSKCALLTRTEMDFVVGPFRDLASEASKAGVVLGFENTLNAEDNARVQDKVNSPAFKIWYDVGNATNLVKEDAAKALRWLGRDRLCQLHFKDTGYLGEGSVSFPAVLAALDEIGFRGFAHLETNSPGKNMEADLARNLAYLRKLMG